MFKKNLVGIVVVILVAAAFAGGFWIGKGGSNASSDRPAMGPDMAGKTEAPTEQTAPTSPQIGQTVVAAPAGSDSAGKRQSLTPEIQAVLTKARKEGKSREEIQALMATFREHAATSQQMAQAEATAHVARKTAAREQSGAAQPEAAAPQQANRRKSQTTAGAAAVPASTTLPDMHEFYGTAAAVAEVNVQSQQGGTIITLNGKEGDTVKKGAVLARFDDSEQRLQIDNAVSSKTTAELQLQQAEAGLKTAQTTLERNQELFKDGLISQQQMDDLQSNMESAQASLNSAREKVKQADTQIALQENSLDDFVVHAPISGIIDQKQYNLQEIYKGSDVLFHIINIEQVYVNVDVPETYIKQVREDMQVALTFNALGDQAFTGVVETILPSGSTSNRTFTVKVLVENPEQFIRPGMFANVRMAFIEA